MTGGTSTVNQRAATRLSAVGRSDGRTVGRSDGRTVGRSDDSQTCAPRGALPQAAPADRCPVNLCSAGRSRTQPPSATGCRPSCRCAVNLCSAGHSRGSRPARSGTACAGRRAGASGGNPVDRAPRHPVVTAAGRPLCPTCAVQPEDLGPRTAARGELASGLNLAGVDGVDPGAAARLSLAHLPSPSTRPAPGIGAAARGRAVDCLVRGRARPEHIRTVDVSTLPIQPTNPDQMT